MNNKFSENLKKIRKDNGLSQEQLADLLGVSRQAISKWESSVAYPEMEKIITLCEKFNLNIDDLLYKDIREVKAEEESKKNLNKYVEDFLLFITNTINMFSSMSFKSKFKCLFEQTIIVLIIFIIWLIIGLIGQELLSKVFMFMPNNLYYFFHTLVYLVYVTFSVLSSVVIVVHIFKIRYLDYYQKIKNDAHVHDTQNGDNLINSENINKHKSIIFEKSEDKIIIRDPIHSEYKFITGLFKGIILLIKFFTLCCLLVLFAILISFSCIFIISFLFYKTGIFFIGLLLFIISSIVINILLILLLLNFVFNRKNDKKKMIWSFVISLIMLGFGVGLTVIGVLNFKFVQNDNELLKTQYIELDMKDNLVIDSFIEIEYVLSNNENIKIEYTINKYCNLEFSDLRENIIHLWVNCEQPVELIKNVIKRINDEKIVPIIINEIQNVKIYSTKENLDILKKNNNKYDSYEIEMQNIINSYEEIINNQVD